MIGPWRSQSLGVIHVAHDGSQGLAYTRNDVVDDLKRALERVWGVSFDAFANVAAATIWRLRKAVARGMEERLMRKLRGVADKVIGP